jgi:hypothetical protein
MIPDVKKRDEHKVVDVKLYCEEHNSFMGLNDNGSGYYYNSCNDIYLRGD